VDDMKVPLLTANVCPKFDLVLWVEKIRSISQFHIMEERTKGVKKKGIEQIAQIIIIITL